MAGKTLGDRVHDHRGNDLSELGIRERKFNFLCIKDIDALGDLLREIQHTVHERSGLVLAVEQDHAGILFRQLDRAVEVLSRMDGLGLQPLHLLKNAHRIVISLAPEHAGTDDHMIIHILEGFGHGPALVFELLLALQQIRNDLCILVHELIILRELAGVLHEAGDQGDHIGVDRFAQAVILGKAEQLVVGIFADRRVVIGDINDRSCADFLAELCGCNDLFGIAAAGREYADGILGEGLGRCSHELSSDHAHGVDLLAGGVEPVLHGQGMGIGAAAADEIQIGIAFFTDLVYSCFNLGAKGDGITDNFLIARYVKIKHLYILLILFFIDIFISCTINSSVFCSIF